MAEMEQEAERRNEIVGNGTTEARSKATNAYSIAGDKKKVNRLINIALTYCAANEDAVKEIANNIDRILVSGNGKLRTLEEVRGISLAVAANFAEHGNAGHVLDDLAGSHRIEP